MERKSITGEKMGKEEKGRELMRMIGRIRVTLCLQEMAVVLHHRDELVIETL
jgi:hypothetical protein